MTAANEALSTDTPATVTFDTLSAAKELMRKTGLEDRQAEAVVTTISKAMSETVATKADLQLLRQYVDSRLDALENRLIIKLGGLMVTMTFLLLAIGPFYIRWVMSLMGTS